MSIIAIESHRLACGDITTGVVSGLMASARADVVYSDPPWGPGNQRYWHTHNGSAPRTDWAAFLAAFCSVCATYRKPDAPVFVEMGLRWVEELDAAMKHAGLPRQRRWDITYGRPARPNALLLYGDRDMPVDLGPNTHGEPITRTILTAVVRPGAIVLDPCCGKGMTARHAHNNGAAFRGSELNAKRLEETASWLRAHSNSPCR